MSNRYFTPKSEAPNAVGIVLADDVDPHGNLTRAAGSGYIHTEDNQVYYFKRQVKSEDDHRFVATSPVTFQVGDIVKVQVSFAVLPLREGRLKTLMILRSISLLDGGQTQATAVLKFSSKMKAWEPRITLKRRMGYLEEEVSVTRAKFVRMEISKKDSEEEAVVVEMMGMRLDNVD
ncbi:hypothetical protein BYT27DRAFT_7215577 [Phlegmacium glaucopus]|nr:hypothetical protein BYT27DRAFT_7215577 [Phlegmacium glaucopus]